MRKTTLIIMIFPFSSIFGQDLNNLDSISLYYDASEIETLIKMDSLFTDFVLSFDNHTKDVNEDFEAYLNDLIKEINIHGYYTPGVRGLDDFMKLNLELQLKESAVFDKIFRVGDSYFGRGEDKRYAEYCAINNINGNWIEFIDYYQTINKLKIWSDYIDALNNGVFPNFIDTLPFYRDIFDFNNQVHRLVLLIHMINHTSKDYYI